MPGDGIKSNSTNAALSTPLRKKELTKEQQLTCNDLLDRFPELSASEYYEVGVLQMYLGNYRNALEAFEEATYLDPAFPNANYGTAEASRHLLEKNNSAPDPKDIQAILSAYEYAASGYHRQATETLFGTNLPSTAVNVVPAAALLESLSYLIERQRSFENRHRQILQ